MTREEFRKVQDTICKMMVLISANKSMEYIASVYDERFSDTEKSDIDIQALMCAAVDNNNSLYSMLDELETFIRTTVKED